MRQVKIQYVDHRQRAQVVLVAVILITKKGKAKFTHTHAHTHTHIDQVELTALQQMRWLVSGSSTRVHSLVRKAGTLLV